jgi:sugar lactone lactonase YvrE
MIPPLLRIGLAALVIAGGPVTVRAQTTPTGPVAAFRILRSEAVTAASAGDLTLAEARLAEADVLIPNHPGLILLRARVAAADDRPGAAVGQLARYAEAGLTLDLDHDAALSALAGTPGYAAVTETIAANRAPVGADRLTPLASVPGTVLVESLVRDETRARWLVSQVAGRTIIAVDDRGTVTPFLVPDARVSGVLGLVRDPSNDTVWATTTALPPATAGRSEPAPGSALLRIDMASGRITAAYPAPDDGRDRTLGDLTMGTDGTLFVADATAGEVLRLRPGAAALDPLVAAGTLGSPQGMVVTPDGAALIVADYSSGLWRIDLSTGGVTLLSAPADASLVGIDGLTTDGRSLYAIQNGTTPQRVLKLVPDTGWTRLAAVSTLAANLPVLDEPTTGLVHQGRLVFVSRSQWRDFADDGSLRSDPPAPAIIVQLQLD